MKILAMDIGAGTQDILLYDSESKLENCIKLVLPSPSLLEAERISEFTTRGEDLFIEGYAVGGGALSKAIKRHISCGFQVIMTPTAAYTIRNNLEDVVARGIHIEESPPAGFKGARLRLEELDLSFMQGLLQVMGDSLDTLDAAAVAVQDHGAYPAGKSNRKTRLAHMRRKLEENPNPLALSYLYGDMPDDFPRMNSAYTRLKEQLSCQHILVMDTAPAAVVGCLADREVARKAWGKLLLMNVGNGHTMAAISDDGRVIALLEHHTRFLEPATFASYLESFCSGEASDDDPFMSSGHGLFYLEQPPGMKALDMIAITGPHRELLDGTGLDFYYPAPGGDMMMTGPMGLVKALEYRLETTG
jgi:uncharacterized protein (DUF1786 family)